MSYCKYNFRGTNVNNATQSCKKTNKQSENSENCEKTNNSHQHENIICFETKLK